MSNIANYGAWKSPVASEILAQASLRLNELQLDQVADLQDTIFWVELRYAEQGRYVVCSAGLPDFDKIQQWTPAGYNARDKVHEYGGGSFCVHNRVLYFSNVLATNGEVPNRVYVQTSPTSEPRPISPRNDKLRFADFWVTSSGADAHALVYAVCEEHWDDPSREPANYLCVIDSSTSQCHKLVADADFYSAPRVNGDRTRIAYVEWHHPSQPWDSTQVRCAQLVNGGLAVAPGSIRVCAGFDVMQSALFPTWLSHETLAYVHDATGYWNVYARRVGEEPNVPAKRYCDTATIEAGLKSERAVFARSEDCGTPPWVFVQASYGAAELRNGDSGKLALTFRNAELYTVGYRVDEHGAVHFDDKHAKVETGPFNYFKLIVYSNVLRTVFAIGGSGSHYSSVLRIPVDGSESHGKVQVVTVSNRFKLDPESISVPRLITYETSDNQVSYANYYEPRNKDYKAPAGTKPPLLVLAHGGPHAHSEPVLRLGVQYYTSRGFAVMDVNYRGSSLFGRKYRDALKNQWGVYDVEDCARAAIYAVDHGLADRNRLCISGGSAGGFLVFACLAFRNVFSAGSALYGVADIEMLQHDTHKFESRYMEQLVGSYPPCVHLYRQRSPIHSVNNISCPLILFQGTDDKVVPPEQSVCIYEAVKRKGLPTSLLLFEGEGHGFCKSDNVRTQIDGEFYFFTKVFGIDAPDLDHVKQKIKIDNLEWLATGSKQRDLSVQSSGAGSC